MKTRAEDDFLFVNLPHCLLHGPVLVRLARSINLILRSQDTEAWRQALGLSREGRMPGRARSHTTARKWEAFGLHGALAGHLAVYRHRGLSPAVTTSVPPGGEPQPVRDVKAAAGPRGKPRFQAVPGR
ncbi:hypothetical protein MBT84_02225 [Streptomyces sp. MBT84]|uniref:hypothetical protein n=1 Tax=unclassified Streptomyces TaxID=2593676 RepID=UPI001C6E1438|nr:hypothetical protein [Streptomyces sp. MBT84]MBW8698384.1 hypothetical protein [Streptomyces sp. MBT84]